MCINYTSLQFLFCVFASACVYRLLSTAQYLTRTNKFASLSCLALSGFICLVLLVKTSSACFISEDCRAALCTVHQVRMNAVCRVLARKQTGTRQDTTEVGETLLCKSFNNKTQTYADRRCEHMHAHHCAHNPHSPFKK